MRYTESTLSTWCAPASNTEEERIDNTIKMIRSAIDNWHVLDGLDIEVFVQGSYANNTNVRTSSDVDVCIMLRNTFFSSYPDGRCREDYGFTPGSISFDEYKTRVYDALEHKFGREMINVGNKSIKIDSNTYHVQADAVIAFMLKDFRIINSTNSEHYIEGIRFYAKDETEVTNYPKDHIKNGKDKNKSTNHKYKKLVRIFKHIRNNMVSDGEINGDIISSFLVECLIWNVQNYIITGYSTWTETVKQAIIYLYNQIKENNHKEWGEVSEHLYLFRGHKWTDADAKDFLVTVWNYLGYGEG